MPDLPGLSDVPALDNDSVLHLDALPRHLVVLGGSYIALEIGQLFGRFGSAVTIIERGDRIAAREDPSRSATRSPGSSPPKASTSGRTRRSNASRRHPTACESTPVPAAPIDGSHLLLAIGRTPNTDLLDLDAIGLATDARGFIHTDGHFRTAVEGVWALGDINGRGAFTHTSYQDYEILVDHLTGDHARPTIGSRRMRCSPTRRSAGSG